MLANKRAITGSHHYVAVMLKFGKTCTKRPHGRDIAAEALRDSFASPLT
jgi:hypothetical protein